MDYKERIFTYIEEHYNIKPNYPWDGDAISATFKDSYSEKWFALYLEVKGKSIGLDDDSYIPIINVKADPDFISFVSGQRGFLPAYHMNKTHWITLRLDGALELNQVIDCINRSYNLIVNTPTRRIYEAVKMIPKGNVATYGQVAELAGDRKMARAVGNALHKNPDPDNIPCFRVVNSKGELAGSFAFGGANVQEQLLINDGIEVVNGKVDLLRYAINVEELQSKYEYEK